jgi:hypothetical protein
MSFSDMMSSGRGPGVIGMVMALIVLLGFGFLFMFAADEQFQGADKSIESVIAYQTRDIENLQGGIEKGQKTLDDAPEKMKLAQELSRLKRGSKVLEERAAVLGDTLQMSHADLVKRGEAFEAYKDSYRALVRAKAKGESIESLETKAGVIYKGVNIREVTAVGIQIRHDEGQKRIPYEELPVAMIDRFQFDPKQKAAAVEKERATLSEHEAAVSAAEMASERQAEELNLRNDEAARQKNIQLLAVGEARIHSLENEVRSLQESLVVEVEKRFSRAPQMRAQLASKQSELASIKAQVARMKAIP